MKIQMSLAEMRNTFSSGFNPKTPPSLLVAGVEYYVWEWTEEVESSGWCLPESTFTLVLRDYAPPVPKSKEQIAAEECVRKAEEALQAAKDTLEKIKEK